MSFTDKTLVCRDCSQEFVFTAGEQDFHAQKGFTNEPGRCPSCRQSRKQGGNDRSGGRGYDDRGSYGGGGGGGYSSERAPREMHTTTCSGCGQPAEVPFVPRGDKPVYCRSCFQGQRANTSRW